MRAEWRELDCFHELDHLRRRWRIVGTRSGREKFADLSQVYARDPARTAPSTIRTALSAPA
jgi:hypothetical protein